MKDQMMRRKRKAQKRRVVLVGARCSGCGRLSELSRKAWEPGRKKPVCSVCGRSVYLADPASVVRYLGPGGPVR